MGALLSNVLHVALGIGVPFSLLAWGYVTVLVLVIGPMIVQVAPRLVDPPARMLAVDPQRVLLWLPLSFIVTMGVIVFLAVTIVGIPLASLVPFVVLGAMGIGYAALARLLGERLLRRGPGVEIPPWLAALVGIAIFRIVRLVPFVGAAAHSLICWIGFAATSAVMWRAAVSWHRRRMPDAQQFAGETLVEWYPDGDPEGPPQPGLGRPVVGNIRGDEERDKQPDVDEDSGSNNDA